MAADALRVRGEGMQDAGTRATGDAPGVFDAYDGTEDHEPPWGVPAAPVPEAAPDRQPWPCQPPGGIAY